MNNLHRELAPVSEVAWAEIEEEAARTLGAPPHRVVVDVLLPALSPALIAAGAIAFATAMGAFARASNASTESWRMRRWPPAVFQPASVPLSTICCTAPRERPSWRAAWAVLMNSRLDSESFGMVVRQRIV